MCEVIMKKVLVFAAFLVFLLLAGCGNKVNFDSHSTVPADDDKSQDPADSGESADSGDPDDSSRPADSGDPEDPDFYDSVDTDIELPLPGNPVYFGTYEQDKDILNGKEPIEWRFLKVERFRAFLLSEYGLDAYRFDENYTGWRGSDIQSWLNEYFYTEAFSDGERAKILETKTSLSVNSAHNYYSYVADKIFLLKRSEIEQYFGEKCDRLVYPTPYANANGALMTVSESCGEAGAAGAWWIYPERNNSYSEYVDSNGEIKLENPRRSDISVRPAMWIEYCADGTFRCDGSVSQRCVKGSWDAGTVCGVYGCVPKTGKCAEKFSYGNLVTFGKYEQDAVSDNGKEPIVWRVIAAKGKKALLLSEKGLDIGNFDSKTNIWRDSGIRTRLNETFFDNAFNDEEKKRVSTTLNLTANAAESRDNLTEDKVFLLSEAEVERYLVGKCGRVLFPSQYVENKNGKIFFLVDSECDRANAGTAYWWLRSQGAGATYYEAYQAIVDYQGIFGQVLLGGSSSSDYVIRPAVWVWLGDRPECEEDAYRCSGSIREICRNGFWNQEKLCGKCSAGTNECTECTSGTYLCDGGKSRKCVDGYWDKGTECGKGCETGTGKCSETGYVIGNTVTFGSYEQDDDLLSGKEPISWKVLEVKDGSALLFSEYVLDLHYWNKSDSTNDWETSDSRAWLNGTETGDFYETAFSREEKKKIVEVEITTNASVYSNELPKVTKDKIFFLSGADAYLYFRDACQRIAYPTPYAVKQGAYESTYSFCEGQSSGATYWWLRSPGYEDNSAQRIEYDGSSSNSEVYLPSGIRPAMWVKF